ncbi:interferon regulatory factor 4-like isoform X1 [Lates japonicus]|uniref:Interferon regulatory factor 4-like isoform X1 n=1 Tax=Lates japonicus TaxID=270547 RepID=A0AAD3NPE5_LATJO|nr:interferon regulatory factor 4-like isoform X1 [Lates japonicus]
MTDELERSQLDILEPHKVYRIIPEEPKRNEDEQYGGDIITCKCPSAIFLLFISAQIRHRHMVSPERRDWRDYPPAEQQPSLLHITMGHMQSCSTVSATIWVTDQPGLAWVTLRKWFSALLFHTYFSESQPPMYTMDHNNPVTESQRQGAEMLPNVLERGVLLRMMHDGLYAKRLCQGRVYWEGPLAPFMDKPNKLEKDQPCKLFDTPPYCYLQYDDGCGHVDDGCDDIDEGETAELQDFAHNGRHVPRHQVVLCFGDEYPDPQRPRKMITAQVEPVFARKLVYYYQQNNGHYPRGYDHVPEQNTATTIDYPSQRPLQHIQE